MNDWALVSRERQALIDLFRTLEPEQWSVPSLCPGWTVHDVLAHLTSVQEASPWQMARAAVLGRGVPSRVITILAEQWSQRSPGQLIDGLQHKVDSHFAPPGLGYRASLTDVMVHRLDVALPLGIEPGRPAVSWQPVLEFLTAGVPLLGTIRTGRPRVRWTASDLGWSAGDGPEVSGPADAIGCTLSGRDALLSGLDGPGVAQVSAWLSG